MAEQKDYTSRMAGGGQVVDVALPLKVVDGIITNNGTNLTIQGDHAWAEGSLNTASGDYSHAEGYYNEASGLDSHAEGFQNTASGTYSHAEGTDTVASGTASHAEGSISTASGTYSHAEGGSSAIGANSHSEGNRTEASGSCSHAEGDRSKAVGDNSHAEGCITNASGNFSHAEGYATKATQRYAHSEGAGTTASGDCAHSEGRDTTASAHYSHAEGETSTASGTASHAEGGCLRDGGNNITNVAPIASGARSHAEGCETVASGTNSHAQGFGTRATGDQSFAAGKYNDDGTALFVIGNGNADNDRSDVFKVDSSGNTWVLIGGVLTQITSLGGGGGGVKMYATVSDAITDQANIAIGDYFTTSGFNSEGDFGAGVYKVTSTGTPNGMDIIQLAAGKIANLLIGDTGYPEQFGYNRFNQDDLTPVMSRMTTAHVRNIKLAPIWSGDSYPYLMKTTFNPTVDVSIEGPIGFSAGAAARIWFVPTTYAADYTPMFNLTNRGFKLKRIVLMNRPWFTESDSHNCVCILMAVGNNNNMWYDFEELAIQGFNKGIFNTPTLADPTIDGIQWHCEFKKLSMALNLVNVELKGLTYLTKFENCFFTVNRTGSESIVLQECFTTSFNRCNFGIYNPAETIFHLDDYIVAGHDVKMRWSNVVITECNFEIESDDTHPLPTSNSHFFINAEDHDMWNIVLDSCTFITTPLARANNYGNRAISLGERTRISIENCSGPYTDVKYTGNEFYGWDFQKRMFDETRHPLQQVGSVIIEHSIGIIPPPNNAWGSVYLPTVKMDDRTIPFMDNNTKFAENYTEASDGVILINLDDGSLNSKIGGKMVTVKGAESNLIRIGDRDYRYVTIDGRKWITENLRLFTMNTREWVFFEHPEFGFYYGPETWTEIDALLPAGWRRPNYNDCQSIITQGYAAVQATGYTAWPNATNSSGLSAIPCGRWKKPDATPDFTRGFIWGPEEVGVGYHAINIQASNISYAGWNYATVTSTSDPVRCVMRVCCDA